MMTDHVTILVITGQHSFSGELANRGLRVRDLLNDVSAEFIQLSKVAVHRHFFDGIIKQLPDASIPKADVDFVLLENDKHEPPIRRQQALVEKRSYSTFAVIGDYELRGKPMLKGAPDTIEALRREFCSFFPMTSAQLSLVGGFEKPVAVGVALINKSKVSLLQIDQQAGRSSYPK
jgi:hypothetical protein